MEPDQQEALDAQVQAVLQELQASGESTSVESVARRLGRRTESVLQAIRRLTTRGTPEPDPEIEPEAYPAVMAADSKVTAITAALQDAERTLTERESLLARAEAAGAEALLDGREPSSLVEARQQVLQAAEMVRLLALAQGTAKTRHAEALAAAEAAHQQAVWQHFQQLLQAHVVGARQMIETWEPLRAYCTQHEWRFGLQPFNGTMQVMSEAWVPHVEALLAQDGPAPGGGVVPVMGGMPRGYMG